MQPSLFDEPEPEITAPPPMEGGVRDYQEEVIKRACDHMIAGRKRGILQCATGGGKTFCAAELARRAVAKNKRLLILADRRKLVSQMGKALDRFGVEYGIIMADETRSTHLPVITASRDTLDAWQQRKFEMPAPFDGIIVDEAHKVEGSVYQRLLYNWPKAFLIGLTATPARPDGKRLDNTFQWLECAIPVSELIARKWLVPTVVKWPKVLGTSRRKGKRRGKTALAGDPVSHWQRHALDLPTVAFCGSIKDSLELRDRFNNADIKAEHIDADNTDAEREGVYDRLREGVTKIICSVGLLIEGVDIEEISAIIIWKKFGSIVEWLQANGRAKRRCDRLKKIKAVCLDHSGASGEHGHPDEDIEWSLDVNSTVQERRKQKLGEHGVIICRKCGTAYQARPTCPDCSEPAPVPKKTEMQRLTEQRQEILSTYEKGDEVKEWALKEANHKIFTRCIYRAIHQNGTFNMVAVLFRKEVKCWPSEAGIQCPASSEWDQKAADLFPDHARCRRKATT